MNENSNRYSQILKIVWIIFFLNLIVAVTKIILGIYTKSASISADGFHSTGDAMDNIIGIVGISLASKPKDRDHAYGHEKYETLASFMVGIILLILAINVISDSINRFINPVIPEITTLSFIVIIITIIINLFVSKYEYNKGKKLKSEFLISDSLHTRSDIYVSLSVLATIYFVKLGYPILDTIISLIIAIVIGMTGIRVLKSATHVLTDASILNPKELSQVVLTIPEVKNCHSIRTRGNLADIKIDLHITVNEKMQVREAHEIANNIEELIKNKYNNISEVIVHVEPDNPKEREAS